MKEEYKQNFHIDVKVPWYKYDEIHSFIEGILENLSELPIYLGYLRYDYLSCKFCQICFDLENEWSVNMSYFDKENSFQCAVIKEEDNIIRFEDKSLSVIVSLIKKEISYAE